LLLSGASRSALFETPVGLGVPTYLFFDATERFGSFTTPGASLGERNMHSTQSSPTTVWGIASASYHPIDPGMPLKGPATSSVIHPP
jgi:hypothetical protein